MLSEAQPGVLVDASRRDLEFGSGSVIGSLRRDLEG